MEKILNVLKSLFFEVKEDGFAEDGTTKHCSYKGCSSCNVSERDEHEDVENTQG